MLEDELEDNLPRYLLKEDSRPLMIFRLFLGVPLFYQLVVSMLYVSLDTCDLISLETPQMILFVIIDTLFLLDLVLNFLTVPKTMI